MSSWVEKHRPESFDGIQGNNKAIDSIEEWARNWSEGDEPQLLHGEPGTGKTTTAIVVSDLLGYPLNEINVSSARTSDDIERMASVMQSSPADNEYQIVLLDEVDSWHHAAEKQPLYDALRNPKNPIILTANDKYEIPDSIKRAAQVRKFRLGKRSRKAKIREIAKREDVDLSNRELAKLSERNDLRSAINDLQNHAESDGYVDFDHRTDTKNEFTAIENLLKGRGDEWRESLSARSDTFRDPGSALLWADHSLSKELRGIEVGVAYEALSMADTHLEKARRSSYRYWRYASAVLEVLPEARLTKPYENKRITDTFPEWFRLNKAKWDDETDESELYQNLKGEQEYAIACSYYEFRRSILPILRSLSESEKKELALSHGLDGKAIEAIGMNPDEYEEWAEIEKTETGKWSPETGAASDTDW